MENACTTFGMHNAVQSTFKRRNISNGRKISHNFRQKRRNIAISEHLGLFRRWGQVCTTFCTHDAVKRAFKRRKISSGREISLNFLQNRRIMLNYVCLDLFRRWKTCALRSARIMQCKGRLNVEISQTGEK